MESGAASSLSSAWQPFPETHAKGKKDPKELTPNAVLLRALPSAGSRMVEYPGSTVQKVYVLDPSLFCSVAPLIFHDIQLDCNF